MQAMLGADDSLKLGAVIKAHKPYLKLLGTDAANQLAQLVALEHYVGVTAPNRVREVFLPFQYPNRPCLGVEVNLRTWPACYSNPVTS